MTITKWASLAALSAGLLAFSGGANAGNEDTFRDYPAPPKTDSHSPEFFRELFPNRVSVATRYVTKYDNGSFKEVREPALSWAKATLLTPDGKTITCDYKNGTTERGHVWKSKWYPKKYPIDPNNWRSVYNPVTGGDYLWYTSRNGDWAPRVIGHWQDTWPQAMLDRCPDAKLPAGFPINKKQTSTNYWELLEQDPAAPVRNFQPTSAGAKRLFTGPRTEQEARDYLNGLNGTVFTLRGEKMVYTPWRGELWRIDREGALEDTAATRIDKSNDRWIRVRWYGNTDKYDWTWITLPLFVEAIIDGQGTDRHPAFAFTDWLGDGRVVDLPLSVGGDAALTFGGDGAVRASTKINTETITGSWWLEKGELNVSMGEFGHTTWPWKVAANQAGYTGPLTLTQ